MSHSRDALAHLGWVFDPDLGREQYVQRVLDAYRQTPTTAGRVRPADRRLAVQLFHRGVPDSMVQAAFSLAAARRTFRDPEAGPLHPIRSLHYFLPVLDEIRCEPIDPDYIRYLEWKLYGDS
ncbi:MAG: hypothetical protein GY769_17115 [bacterium]|nr:hypothetical protein [bacterium]